MRQIWSRAGVAAMVVAGSMVAVATLHAGDSAVARFRGHLREGHFGQALAVARGTSNQRRHDAMLALLALSQLQSGSDTAARKTAGEIYQPQTQQQVIDYMHHRLTGGQGGGVEPDFESLMELIRATIAPDSWADVGGPGAIDSFAGGVFVDAQGTLRPLVRTAPDAALLALHQAAAVASDQDEVRQSAPLRMISLPRLKRAIDERAAAELPPTEAMQMLAGLQRVRYVFVYPESREIVLAGPAGDWRRDHEGRWISRESGQPVVRYEDLIVVLRHMLRTPDARFGCSITPTSEGLARTQAFLAESSKSPLRPGQRERWLAQLRDTLGHQTIDVLGLDPRTRVARVMVEADYRMKRIGMGLEEGVLGVESYLDSIHVPPGQAPPPMDVLRWWFTLNYQSVLATENRSGFEIRGQGVRVLSENELLTERGERVHTGKSDALNQQFAQSFTTHFDALCEKYPLYADLRNIFDLALVGALLRAEELVERADCQADLLPDAQVYRVGLGPAARQVETVINHRVINKAHILAGVSGGVVVAPAALVQKDAMETDQYGLLRAQRVASQPKDPQRWWWD